jgi:hypothetical protein
MLQLTSARVVGPVRVWLAFSDGSEGEVELHDILHGPVFEPLRDPALFGRAFVDPEFGALAWPNGADLAPEFLCDRLKSTLG